MNREVKSGDQRKVLRIILQRDSEEEGIKLNLSVT